MNSTYYPSKARYFLTFQTAYTKWLKLQGLPPSLVQHLQPFLEHQWRLHNAHLKQQPFYRSITPSTPGVPRPTHGPSPC